MSIAAEQITRSSTRLRFVFIDESKDRVGGFGSLELATIFSDVDALLALTLYVQQDERPAGVPDSPEQAFRVTRIMYASPLETVFTIMTGTMVATALANRLLTVYQRFQAVKAEHAKQWRDEALYEAEKAQAGLDRQRIALERKLLASVEESFDEVAGRHPNLATAAVRALHRLGDVEVLE